MLAPVILLSWILLVVRTGRLPSGDGLHLLGVAMRLVQQVQDLEFLLFFQSFGQLVGPHPPGAYVPAFLSYLFLGTSWQWTHLIAGAMLLWLCWDGMRRLGGGVVSAVFLAATGLVWLQAEGYGADLVAAACVVQAVSHLAVSDRLNHRKHVLAWAAWMGGAFLSKYTAPMFLWGPCLVAGWWVVRGRQWRRLAQALAVFGLVTAPWYAAHFDQVWGYLSASTDPSNELLTAEALDTAKWWTLDNLSWYPAALVDAWGLPGVIAVLVAAGWRARRPGVKTEAWILPVAAALGGWLVLALQIQHQDRYMLPVLPLLAAVVGSCRLWIPLGLVGAIGAYGATAVYATGTDVPASRSYNHDLATAGEDWPWVHQAYRPTSFDPRDWQLDAALKRLRDLHGSDSGTVGFLLDDRPGAPGFGNVLCRANLLGYRWHIATVMLLGESMHAKPSGKVRAKAFVGPFTTEAWPPREFTALMAVLRVGHEPHETWLQQSGLTLMDTWSLDQGFEARFYLSEAGPLEL